jgi:hypothetical protein
VVAGQHLGDQLRTPPVIHPGLERGAQLRVVESELLWPPGIFGGSGMCHQCVVVPVGTAVAGDLAAYRPSAAADEATDLGRFSPASRRRMISTRGCPVSASHNRMVPSCAVT